MRACVNKFSPVRSAHGCFEKVRRGVLAAHHWSSPLAGATARPTEFFIIDGWGRAPAGMSAAMGNYLIIRIIIGMIAPPKN